VQLRKVKTIFINLVIFIGINNLIVGQNIQTNVDRITGMSQQAGNCIIQDNKGFIWIGTYGGLNKYDGYSFKYYLNEAQDSTSLSYEGIAYLYEDHSGYIWVVNNSSQIGLDRYDPRTDQFTHYTFNENDSSSLSNNQIFHIMEDENNRIWICTNNALNQVIPDKEENLNKIHFQRYYYPSSRTESDGTGFSMIHVDRNDRLLLISPDLYYFDLNTKEFIDANLEIDISQATSIVSDNRENLWIGTSENGVIRITYDDSVSGYRLTPCPKLNVFQDDYTFLEMDDQNNLWIGSETKGLFRYDPETDFLEDFPSNKTNAHSMSESSVRSLFIDRTGVLWVGTLSQELCKTDLNRKEFIHYKNIPGNTNSLKGNLIADISGINPEELWVGSRKDGGVSRFIFKNSGEPRVIRYQYDPQNENTIGGDHTLSLEQRKNGDVWIGSAGEIITRIIPGDPDKSNTDVIERFYVKGWTFSIFEDGDSILWGGTWNEGLWRLNETDQTFTKFYHNPEDSQSLIDNIIWAIGEDKNKNLWIGTNGQGLSILSADQKQSDKPRFINYQSEIGNLKSINHNTINVFYQDRNGTMWVGTNGGLNRVVEPDGTDQNNHLHHLEFISYTIQDGLPHNSIVGVLEDEKGNLWISTANGLSMFDFSDSTFVNYYESDGLQGNVFIHNAYFKNSNGRMHFGGSNGFNAFYPKDIRANQFLPQISFTDLKVWNKSVSVGEEVNEDIILPKSINEVEEITLSHENNAFSIEFAALHYAHPEHNKYAYYLERYEDTWVYSENQRSATYTNLNPGVYVFRVRGSNNNGIWNNEGRSLTIKILPPWWETWWFRILLFLIILGVVFLFFYLRTKSLLRQKAALERKVNERTIRLNDLVKELQVKQNDLETSNEELTATLEDLFAQKEQVEKINSELNKTQEELKIVNSQLDQRVQERTSKLVKANQELDRFVYSASHDLSAPLKSIMGLINIAYLERKKVDLINHLKHMETSVNKLENVIQSLTQYSRNSGQEIRKAKFSFNELVNEVLEDTTPLNNNSFSLIKDFDPTQIMNSDFFRLKIIMSNLISNAFKYRKRNYPDAYIKISFQQKDNTSIISVKDNGTGIESKYKSKIFDMFYRASTLSNGSGLGLYIVKETVEKLKGEIKIDSVKHEYTEVTIMLPE